MLEAFNYMFKDNMFKKKAFMYFILFFIANFICNYSKMFFSAIKHLPNHHYSLIFSLLLIFALLFAISLFIVSGGYNISCVKAIIEQKKNYILPFINFKRDIIIGLKYGISLLVLLLTLFLIYVFVVALVGLIMPFATEFISKLLNIILTILPFFYMLAFTCIYAKTEKLASYVSFFVATKLISLDFWNYFKYFTVCVVFLILWNVINATIMGIFDSGVVQLFIRSLLLSLIASYTVFLCAYLTAKSVKSECIE